MQNAFEWNHFTLHMTWSLGFYPGDRLSTLARDECLRYSSAKHKNVERAASASMGTILSWMKSFFSRAFGRICKRSLFLYIYIIYFTTLRFSECAYILAHI